MRVARTRLGPQGTSPVYEGGAEDGRLLDRLRERVRVDIVEDSEAEVVFDLVGVDAPIANALRRILLAEVPTMAIDTVMIHNNTSIIHDEVLAHRLGLIPLNADPREFEMCGGADPNDYNTLIFDLVAEGKPPVVRDDGTVGDDVTHVFSSDLIWFPYGSQGERFAERPIAPVHPDILIAKLKPGQKIHLRATAVKGVGKDHAKWSPVATASYRLLPEILLREEVRDADALELKAKCPVGVFDIEDLGGGHSRAVVAHPRSCTMCRECIRDPAWEPRVVLQRVQDHFIFSVESTGAMRASDVVKEAFHVLRHKAATVLEAAELAEHDTGADADAAREGGGLGDAEAGGEATGEGTEGGAGVGAAGGAGARRGRKTKKSGDEEEGDASQAFD